RFYKFGRLASVAVITLAAGCLGGGYANNGGYTNGVAGMNSAGSNPLGAVESALLNSIAQNMAGSVLNGQIGSQVTPADQNFRLQQLGGLIQSGAVNQSQQWVNPQTGSAVAVNPIGQSTVNPQTQQQCQNLEETITLPNGQSIRENRVACLDSQTGKWNLVQ
ncbi:MAG: hypothetical protein ACXWAT_05110, partial [Methylobacter sp.]